MAKIPSTSYRNRRKQTMLSVLVCFISFAAKLSQADHRPHAGPINTLQQLDIIVPASPGGGLDMTAQAIQKMMLNANLAKTIELNHLPGQSGGLAIQHLISNSFSSTTPHNSSWMVQSTPIVLRGFTQRRTSYRQLVPLASVIGDYSILALRSGDALTSLNSVIKTIQEKPSDHKIIGGSTHGGLDHVIAAWILHKAKVDTRHIRYIPTQSGGQAVSRFLNGEGRILSASLSEVMEAYTAGKVRLIAISAPEKLSGVNAPTLTELGIPVVFSNWRGFFAAPQTDANTVHNFQHILQKLRHTKSWQSALSDHHWQDMLIYGKAFEDFLAAQERQFEEILRELGFIR